MELNRILRPGGFFVWSATPVYRDDERDRNVWNCKLVVSVLVTPHTHPPAHEHPFSFICLLSLSS